MCKVRIAALIACLAAPFDAGSQPADTAVFRLEIPSAAFTLNGNAAATLPPGNPTHLRIHINVPSAQIGYGNIFARINTESAAVIMTTSATATGVNCDFDLTRRQGFRLRPGRNSVEIAVQDTRGRLRYASFLLDMSSQTQEQRAAAPVAEVSGERLALVIGISQYRAASAGVRNLAFAGGDAKALRDFLVSPQGAHAPERVVLLLNEDATLARIREALGELGRQATEHDLVTVALLAHGVTDPDDPRRNYLLAYDSRPGELGETALAFSDIEDFFGRALRAKNVVTVLDVAHANALSRSTAGGNTLVHQYLTRYATGGARSVLAAADVGQSSWEPGGAAGTESPFAKSMLEGLNGEADANRDGTVTFGELKTFVRDRVRAASGGQQSPNGTVGEGDATPLAGLRARSKP